MTTTETETTFEALLDDVHTVFGKAGLMPLVVAPGDVTGHVAVVGENSGVYRCVPANTGLHVWWVPVDGDPTRIACAPTPARAAGAILDHREGVPA